MVPSASAAGEAVDNIERLAARADSDDEERLFEELEKDDSQLASIRERRMEQLKKDLARVDEMKSHGNGKYTEAAAEKEILKITTSVPFCVVHFCHKEFRRCQIVDKHLAALAPKHFKTNFCKIDVENAPFLVEKLKIQVLPCIIAFVNGVSVDRIVGFDELGHSDDFSTDVLAYRLSKSGVIELKSNARTSHRTPKTIFGKERPANEESADDYDSD